MAITMEKQTSAPDAIAQQVAKLHTSFTSGLTKPLAYRAKQLAGMLRFINECEHVIVAALRSDLGKSAAEALATEMALLKAEIKYTQKHLSSWIKRKAVKTPLIIQPGKSFIYPEPLGVVLIIAPWNYPLQLLLSPLIGALAAGNCAVLKPSELAPATSKVIARLLPEYIDPQCVTIVAGGVAEATELLQQKFDHIFYTGNQSVGSIVMQAAAKNLTPVTLELGGKSPCIVDESANLDVAAQRIVWGKFTNAGQTCVAPDYVLVHESVEKKLLEHMRNAIQKFYGNDPKTSQDYGRIINRRHLQRLMDLIPGGGDIYLGGNHDDTESYLAPTILRNVPVDAPVMTDEIFGPILPVISVKNLDDAIAFVNARPKPLSLYLFSARKTAADRVIANTSSGGVCINYTLLQLTVPALPFGGVGQSGMGVYHGKSTFDTFTHYKSVLIKPTWFNPSILYPPYRSLFTKLIRWIM